MDSSDRRFKKEILPLVPGSLSIVTQLEGVSILKKIHSFAFNCFLFIYLFIHFTFFVFFNLFTYARFYKSKLNFAEHNYLIVTKLIKINIMNFLLIYNLGEL